MFRIEWIRVHYIIDRNIPYYCKNWTNNTINKNWHYLKVSYTTDMKTYIAVINLSQVRTYTFEKKLAQEYIQGTSWYTDINIVLRI